MPKADLQQLADSAVRYGRKNRQTIRELCEGWFPESFRTVTVNREEERFDILLVDADEKKVKEFELKYPQCSIEVTVSKK